MPLGLARDSMVDLAELAKKVEDGECKTSIEITDIDDTPPENMVQISHKKQTGIGNGFHASTYTAPSSIDRPERGGGGESKVDNDHEDIALHDEDDRSSIESSSIDSDIALHANSAAVPSTTPPSMMNGSSSPSKSKNYGRYSGFHAVDYDDYYQHDYTAYSGNRQTAPNLLGNKESQPFWCCFLPWVQAEAAKLNTESSEREEEEETLVNMQTTPASSTTARSFSKEEDEASVGSDALGERLSEKDRQAVLARLRLAQPEEVTSSDSDANNTPTSPDPNHGSQKGLLNGIAIPQTNDGDDHNIDSSEEVGSEGISNGDINNASSNTKKPRGILRIHSRTGKNNLQATSPQISGDARKRRSLFPSYSETETKKKDVNVSFSPMARVLSVKSNKDMEDSERGEIWWQKNDYGEFRKTGRMIAKAMLEGGSEIWLATNQSWQMPNQARSTTLRHATSLSEKKSVKKKGTSSSKTRYENTRDKWWHKFGHSRRGLEHIASIDEGRQRQGNVRRAIRAIVEENKRQRAFFREDADKLRMVSLQHTTWARDLSIAAGASDADAVYTNFNDESRKSREFYLLKFSRARQQQQTKDAKKIPSFMLPATSSQVQPNRLDANTIPQIRYRQSTNKKKLFASGRLSGVKVTPLEVPSPQKEQQQQQQQTAHQHGTSMAKKAAGYASGEAIANMSAVLTGMGALPKSATMVT